MIVRRMVAIVHCTFRHTVQHVNIFLWWGPRTFLVEIANFCKRDKDDWLCQLGFLSREMLDFPKFCSQMMCHNPIRLWHIFQNNTLHQIVTHYFGTKFWRKILGCVAFPFFDGSQKDDKCLSKVHRMFQKSWTTFGEERKWIQKHSIL